MADVEQRHRLVFLGAGGVGKSSIIKRFLQDSFSDTYKETIEDLYCKEYDVQGSLIKVDILDTAGNLAFPAMRRLSISTAHAFVLVYDICNFHSFEEVRRIREQIKEERTSYEDLPCVVVGNKADCEEDRQVTQEDVIHWLYDDGMQSFLEVSAKTGQSVLDIFKLLLDQAKLPYMRKLEPMLRRRLSVTTVVSSDDTSSEEQGDKETKKFSRSRSLIRRGSRPKVKRSSNKAKKSEMNECAPS
ncbi:GTP-binding protein Di-Ras2-like [Liolophura sinensis]|uniref:GTP-binding protein Di-Ras2-like n=1 Tax=Liolophura sinensis TaxID=3198878 RepID=UPI003158B9DA